MRCLCGRAGVRACVGARVVFVMHANEGGAAVLPELIMSARIRLVDKHLGKRACQLDPDPGIPCVARQHPPPPPGIAEPGAGRRGKHRDHIDEIPWEGSAGLEEGSAWRSFEA